MGFPLTSNIGTFPTPIGTVTKVWHTFMSHPKPCIGNGWPGHQV